MINTVDEKFFCQVEQIDIEYMKFQAQEYFGLQGIGNVDVDLKDPPRVTYLQNLEMIMHRK